MGDGQRAENKIKTPQQLLNNNAMAAYGNSAPIQDIKSKFASGGMDLASAIKASQAYGSDPNQKKALEGAVGDYWSSNGGHPIWDQNKIDAQNKLDDLNRADDAARASFGDQLAIDPLTGSKLATDQVRNNDILKGLYGEGGALERANAEEKDLATRGYSLQPEDYEAYGQASNNIARMFGGQENALAQALAAKGLASGPSGAAAVNFSGLQGNKAEQLKNSQFEIAKARMDSNLKRLQATRDYQTQLGQQGEAAINNQYNRNASGVAQKYGQANKATELDQNQQRLSQDQSNQAFEQEQATKGPGIGDIAGAIGGGLLGGFTGGLGKTAGSNLGKKLF